MAEETDQTGIQQGTTDPVQSSTDDPRTVPLKALTSERTKRQALEARLAELEKAAAEKSEAEAAERGQYRDLWESRGKPAEEKVSQLTAKIEAFEAARMARLEKRREALGAFADGIPEGMAGDQLEHMLSWAETLKAKASSSSAAPVLPTGQGSQDNAKAPTKISEREAEWMRRTKPSWLNAPEDRQRVLLDRFGPAWAKRSN
jgi:hypothetical protein